MTFAATWGFVMRTACRILFSLVLLLGFGAPVLAQTLIPGTTGTSPEVLAVAAELTQVAAPRVIGGWTRFSPSADTDTIYVSSSIGNDATAVDNDVYRPYKTLAAAVASLRADKPDWLLLKRGDVWTDEVFGNIDVTGRSETEPMLIGAYGNGARPRVQTAAGGKPLQFIADTPGGKYQAVTGIEFYAYTRDPANPAYAGPSTGKHGIRHLNASEWFLVEDCVFRFYSVNLDFEGAQKRKVIIRRNIVADAYSIAGVSHSQGVFMSNVREPVLEENVLDHNGWNSGVSGAEQTIFNHNVYLTTTTGPARFVGNISANASSHGAQMRSGGTAQNNLFVHNPIGLLLGLDLLVEYIDVTDNIFTQSNDIGAGQRGWGIDVHAANSLLTQRIGRNIITHTGNPGGEGHALTLTSTTINVDAHDNVVFKWNKGIKNKGINNRIAPNRIDLDGDNSEFAFPDPNRTVASYDASIGGPGTLDHFMEEARKQSKDNWRPQYTAAGVNDYIRAGF